VSATAGSHSGLWTVLGDEPLLVLEAGDTVRGNARAAGFS